MSSISIVNKEINGKQIIAEVDREDNSLDIGVVVDGSVPVTLNISVDDTKILIRKWVGYGADSEDEAILLTDVE